MTLSLKRGGLGRQSGSRTVWLAAGLLALVLAAGSLWQAPAAIASSHTDALKCGAAGSGPPVSGEKCEEEIDASKESQTLGSVVETALNILTWVAGIAAVFVLIIAGIRYVVSGGSSSGVTGAKNMIIYALIGVVIALLAQIIVRFVIGNIDTATENESSEAAPAVDGEDGEEEGVETTSVTYTCTRTADGVDCSPALEAGDPDPCTPGTTVGSTCTETIES